MRDVWFVAFVVATASSASSGVPFSCTHALSFLNLFALSPSSALASTWFQPFCAVFSFFFLLAGLANCHWQDEGITPNLFHYNSMFMALERGERWREAADLFRKMRQAGVKPNALTYQPLIGVMDRCQRREMVSENCSHPGAPMCACIPSSRARCRTSTSIVIFEEICTKCWQYTRPA